MVKCIAGAAQLPAKKKGAGTKMLDDMRKKGKPVTPKLEEMALWLDSIDTSSLDDGQVSQLPSRLYQRPAWLLCEYIIVSVLSEKGSC